MSARPARSRHERFAAFLVLSCALCACHAPARPAALAPAALVPPRPGYRLVWRDEFDGTSLDTGSWTAYAGPRRGARNSADAVAVADGVLTIATRSEAGTHYTGFLDTAGKRLFTYGWFEARIRFESAPGEWGAFWLSSPTIGRPVGDPGSAGTEIDVVEHRFSDTAGADISNGYVMNLHWDGYGADHKTAGGRGGPPPGAEPLQGGWHVYALQWTAQGYRFYLDGIEQWASSAGLSHRPEFIKLTCEIQDASWAGRVPAGGYRAGGRGAPTMQVDWLRVWQPAP